MVEPAGSSVQHQLQSETDEPQTKEVSYTFQQQGFQERLIPSVWVFSALFLLVPAVMLALAPLQPELGFILAPAMYLFFALVLSLTSPKIRVSEGILYAGRAHIPLAHLGEITVLEGEQLRQMLGPKANAQAYTLVRGWIHKGVMIENTDPKDPTPYWLLTTRAPHALTRAIRTAQKQG